MSEANQSGDSSSRGITSPSQASLRPAEAGASSAASQSLYVSAEQVGGVALNVAPPRGAPCYTPNPVQQSYALGHVVPNRPDNAGLLRYPITNAAGPAPVYSPANVSRVQRTVYTSPPGSPWPFRQLCPMPLQPTSDRTPWPASPDPGWRYLVPQPPVAANNSPVSADPIPPSQPLLFTTLPVTAVSPGQQTLLQHQQQQQQQQHIHLQQQQHIAVNQELARQQQDILNLEQQLHEKKESLAQSEHYFCLHQQPEFPQYTILEPQQSQQQGAVRPPFLSGPVHPAMLSSQPYDVPPPGGLDLYLPAFAPSAQFAESTVPPVPGMSALGTEVVPAGPPASSETYYTGVPVAFEQSHAEQDRCGICSPQNLSPVPQDSHVSGAPGQTHPVQLRTDAQEFVPRERPQRQAHQEQSLAKRKRYWHPRSSPQSTTAPPADEAMIDTVQLQRVKRLLHNYSLRTLAPCAAQEEEALEHIKRSVTRVPAVYFNEQKFDEGEEYTILSVPQSPARRGQEALARVCFAVEETLRRRNTGAAIISDYKFKECYMKLAPKKVVEVLPTPAPEDEGTHDILIVGMEFGIACVQVTCVEASTNSGTIKKQVRETLKQLEKDVKVVKHLLRDIQLDDRCVRKVLALPNITTQKLKEKLDIKFIKMMQSALDTDDDLQDLLSLDCLPGVGHRHWSAREPRDKLNQRFEKLASTKATLSVENYMQIFARYTGSWSLSEVWGMQKPRFQVRSLAHAVSLTALRYSLPVLTCQQHHLLLARQPHLLIEAPPGSGATCLLKVKAKLELRRGCTVLVILPGELRHLREEYETFVRTLQTEEHVENVYLWSSEGESSGIYGGRLTSAKGEVRTLDSFNGGVETVALCDLVNRDESLSDLVRTVTQIATSTWIVVDAPTTGLSLPDDTFHLVRFETLTRVPTSIQVLLRYASHQESPKPPSSFSSAADPQVAAPQNAAEVSSYVGLPTDGPPPMFIWHPVETPNNGILRCAVCMSRLRSMLVELVADFASDHFTTAAAGETESHAEPVLAPAGEELDINSGNVPRPLTLADVAIFVDSEEDVDSITAMLKLANVDKVVYPISSLPRLLGTEKAVVVFAGGLKTDSGGGSGGGEDTIMHAVVSQLRDVMTLCQGQLILALQVTPGTDQTQPSPGSDRSGQLGPFQLDLETMLEQARALHI